MPGGVCLPWPSTGRGAPSDGLRHGGVSSCTRRSRLRVAKVDAADWRIMTLRRNSGVVVAAVRVLSVPVAFLLMGPLGVLVVLALVLEYMVRVHRQGLLASLGQQAMSTGSSYHGQSGPSGEMSVQVAPAPQAAGHASAGTVPENDGFRTVSPELDKQMAEIEGVDGEEPL